MARRLKDYRAQNAGEGNSTKDYFIKVIGHENVLEVDATKPESQILAKMAEIIEQKGKPCCINMITESDRKFLANLERQALKDAKAKARAETAAQAAMADAASKEGSIEENGEHADDARDSEEDIDEIDLLILQQERELAEKKANEEAKAKQEAIERELQRAKEKKAAAKIEKLRE